jgi:RNA polymerase sigma-70 factor, ECF subfamily
MECGTKDHFAALLQFYRWCIICNDSKICRKKCWPRCKSYDQIADILKMEEANVRQLASRARKHIADGRRTSVSSNEQRRFLEAFIAAAQKGDMGALEGLLAEDVVSYSNGGGLVPAAGIPVSGRKRVATFIAALSKWCWNGVALDR